MADILIPTSMLYTYRKCCLSKQQSYTGQTTIRHSERPVDHRPRPKPLTDTARSVAFTATYLPQYYAWQVEATDNSCPAGPCRLSTSTYIHNWSPGLPINLLPVDQNALNFKVRDSISKLRSSQSGLFAEIDETLESVSKFVSLTADVISCFSSGNIRLCNKVLHRTHKKFTWKTIPAANLRLNFEIKPLVNDLNTIVQRLKNPDFSLRRAVRVTLEQHDSIIGSSEPICRTLRTTSTRVKLLVTLKDGGLFGNFNPGNPLEWAWERIPFSFVVDWVLPVGNWIQSLSALNNVASIVGTQTEIKKLECVPITSYVPPEPGYKGINLNRGHTAYKQHERKIVNSFAIPSFVVWKPSESYIALGNALSLLAVLRKHP